MSSTQMANHQSPSRVLCCFIVSLSFVIIVPTLWINLVLEVPAEVTGRDSAILPPVVETDNSNRTVRLGAHSFK